MELRKDCEGINGSKIFYHSKTTDSVVCKNGKNGGLENHARTIKKPYHVFESGYKQGETISVSYHVLINHNPNNL